MLGCLLGPGTCTSEAETRAQALSWEGQAGPAGVGEGSSRWGREE